MIRLTVRSVGANRSRFALTTSAVVLAVGFVASSFMLTDGIRSAAGQLSVQVVSRADLELRPTQNEFGATSSVDDSLVDAAIGLDGVAAAVPVMRVEDEVRLIGPDGNEVTENGALQLTSNWVDEPALSSFEVVDGRAPVGEEFTLDADTAVAFGFELGEAYDVSTPTGPARATLSGLVGLDQPVDTLGTIFVQFPVETLVDFTGADGFDAVQVVLDDGATAATVEAQLWSLGDDLEVVDRSMLEAETADALADGAGVLGVVLLGFALIATLVSIFIISNTFSIVLRQRTREFSMLRAVGASAKQIRRAVLGEAIVVGFVASILGIVVGIGLAYGLRAAFNALGAGLPDAPLVISMRTIATASIVGIGATLVAAFGPARRSARVPVIVALTDGERTPPPISRPRLGVGSIVLAGGIASIVAGLLSVSAPATPTTLLGIGSFAFFVGTMMIGPIAAQPAIRFLGWPLGRLLGPAGALARQNAAREPRRASTAASALTIGLVLVSMSLTVGESVKAQLQTSLDDTIEADYIVGEGERVEGLPAALAADLDALAETEHVVGLRSDLAKIDGKLQTVTGTGHRAAASLFDWDIKAGASFDSSVANPVLVSDEKADARGYSIGDTVTAEFASGMTRRLTVVGVFAEDEVLEEHYVLDLSTWDAVGNTGLDLLVALSLADGVSADEANQAFASLSTTYPQAEYRTAEEYTDLLQGFVDQTLLVLNMLVALAVIIALIGIANTLALSVIERTREIGLLRAVGMTRTQVQRMVRCEAALVAMFGASLGAVTGVVLGGVMVVALPDTFVSTLSVPYAQVVALIAVAGVAGGTAARAAARRAGRLDVLDAVAA